MRSLLARFCVLAALALPCACGQDAAVNPAGSADTATASDAQPAADSLAAAETAPDSAPATDSAPDSAHDSPSAPDSAPDAAPDFAAPAPECATATDCTTGNPCLLPACSAKGLCLYTPKADAAPCDDKNACTAADQCTAGTCAGSAAIACDDGNPCTADKCNPFSGCANLPVAASTACDDGDPCTLEDHCAAGKCGSSLNTCQCQASADCGKFEDGDQCNGTLYCDKSAGAPYTCKVNPASLVVCPVTADNACQKNTCVPATGQCKLVLAPANTPCDDGDKCTQGDFCDSGLCSSGANTCYCKKDADCAAFEDGNQCNGTLFCNKASSTCQINPITVVNCQTVDDTYCSQNLCNPKDGKCYYVGVHEGKACDDGNSCTPNEVCAAGQCQSAANTCECQKDADCAAKDDGNLCNGKLYCDLQAKKCQVNPATVVHCNTDDDPACLSDVCDPKAGKCALVALPKDGTVCDDGNPCTPSSQCASGSCQASTNTCQCQKDADCAAKEDGNFCNGTLYCDLPTNKCIVNPATIKECTGAFDDTCLTNQCDPKTGGCGMKPAHQGNQCDDGALCSGGGWCNLGACAVTVKMACDCTLDSDCAALDDGNLCNGVLYCDKTGSKPICKTLPQSVVVCKTVGDTACAKNLCQPKTGLCAILPQTGPCDDGLNCTDSDACQNGNCIGLPKNCADTLACTADSCKEPFGCVHLPGPASACDDNNPCTDNLCDTAKGCVSNANTLACDDGNSCTKQDSCKSGLCTGGLGACDDGNPCTDDACQGGKCTNSANTGACNDNNPCTLNDSCATNACVGKAKDCNDNDACTSDTCDPKTGACAYGGVGAAACDDKNPCTDDQCVPVFGCQHSNVGSACTDGNPCTVGDLCKSGKCAPGNANPCDDGNPCTDDSCDASKGGCLAANNSKPCNDGKACTTGDTCNNGACAGTVACNDKDPCTLDACDLKTGTCVTLPFDSSPCDDGNPCTTGEQCNNKVCGGGALLNCDDGNLCTDDNCDAKAGGGCYHLANTAPCDNGQCTVDDACANSACKTGTLPLLGNTAIGQASATLTATTVYDGQPYQGDVVVCGAAATNVSGTFAVLYQMPGSGHAFVGRIKPNGTAAWMLTDIKASDGQYIGRFVSILPLANGDWFLAGETVQHWPAVAKVSKDGKLLGAEAYVMAAGSSPSCEVWQAVARPATGDFVLSGSFSYLDAGKLTTYAMLFAASSAPVFTETATVTKWWPTRAYYASSAVMADGKTLFTVGKAEKASYYYMPIYAVQAELTGADPLSTKSIADYTGSGELRAVTAVPGGFLAAGYMPMTGQGDQYLVARFDGGGNLLWHKTLGSAKDDRATGLLALADGTALMTGVNLSASAGWQGTVTRLDQSGAALAGAETGLAADDFAYGARPLSAGVVAIFGSLNDSKLVHGLVARMTPYLQTTCALGGACAKVGMSGCDPAKLSGGCNVADCPNNSGTCTLTFATAGTCSDNNACTEADACDATSKTCKGAAVNFDDKNPCTFDTCDKAKGVLHSNVPDGTDCGGGKKCNGGVCL